VLRLVSIKSNQPKPKPETSSPLRLAHHPVDQIQGGRAGRHHHHAAALLQHAPQQGLQAGQLPTGFRPLEVARRRVRQRVGRGGAPMADWGRAQRVAQGGGGCCCRARQAGVGGGFGCCGRRGGRGRGGVLRGGLRGRRRKEQARVVADL
jgi:hypothetical protein